MKKLKRVSILLLTIATLTATTACDFSLKKSDTTPTSDNNTNNVDTGTSTNQGVTTTPSSGDGNTTNPSSGEGSTTIPSGDSTQGQDSGNTQEPSGGDTPTQQTTKYEVTFETNGGSSITKQNVESGKTISTVSTTKSGCSFAGWYTDASLTQAFDVSTAITGNLKLYAKWTAKVTFNTNNGTSVTEQTVVCGNTITAVTTSRNGYDFAGWYTDQALKTEFNTTTPITENITLYAKWTQKATPGNIISESAAYNEGAYIVFEASSAKAASNSTVSYSQDGVNWSDPINSNLIRYDDTSKTARADILGLKAGSYLVKVNNTDKESITATLNVSADDRSGYAHHNNSDGVGAYKNDGTLKSNAVVIYVTDANKNTVSYGGKIGLVNIIKNANASTPLDIRILGDIKTCQFNKLTYSSSPLTTALLEEQANSIGGSYTGYTAAKIIEKGWNSYSTDLANGITELNGLSSSVSYGGNSHNKSVYTDAFDTAWNMCNVSGKSNITIEGVGTDAGIFQWGFSFGSCNNIEVKNLRFHNYTEDAIGIEGGSNFWLHNNTFDIGVNNWDFSDEQDKGDGDGATDFKKASNLTISYCRYNNTHKTNLIGGSDSNLQQNVTLHHNYYNKCSSRLPLGRQANMHFYNNYYYQCSTCQDIRANAFVLSEYNYFDKCSNPQKISSNAVIKSYNDYLTSNCGSSAATVVTSRTQTLSGSCKPDGSTDYTNFDTDSTKFYYENGVSKVAIMNQTSELPTLIPNVAGAGALANFGIGEFSDVNTDVETFTVNFETNGGTSVNSQTVVSGGIIRSVSTTRSGYTFNGWSTKADLSDSFDVTTPITGTLTLYAKWEENTSSQTTDTAITFNDFTTGSFDSSLTSNGVTITPKSNKTSEVKTCDSTTVGGNTVSKYVAFGGAGNYSNLSVQFTTTAASSITVYYAGNVSSGVGRKVALYNNSGLVSTATTETTGSGVGKVVNYTFTDVEAGSYAITSSGSSIEIYAIVITY